MSPFGPEAPRRPTSPFSPLGPSGPCGPGSPFSPFDPGGPIGPISPLSPLGPGGPWGPGSPLSPLAPGGPCRPGSPFSLLGPGGPWGPGAPAGPLGPPGPGWCCRSANCLASLLTRASSASRRSDGDGLRGTLGLAARTLLAWLVGASRLAVLLLGLRAMAASYMKGDVGYVRCVSRTNCAPQKHNGPLGITIPTGPSASHAMISATGIAAPQNESPGSAFQPGRTLPLIGGQSQGGKIEVTHQHSARGPRTPRRPRPTSGLPPSTIPRTSSPSHPTGGRPSSRGIAWTSLTPNKWGQACVIA